MTVYLSGLGNCQDLYVIGDATTSSGVDSVTIVPITEGTYSSCSLYVEDHAGNLGWIIIDSFTYDLDCGDGVIDPEETCDEGRACEDGTDCTSNP